MVQHIAIAAPAVPATGTEGAARAASTGLVPFVAPRQARWRSAAPDPASCADETTGAGHALVIGRFPPAVGPDVDRALAHVVVLAQLGYRVETLALAGEGHLSQPFDRAHGLAAISAWLAGRRFDLVVLEPEAMALRRPDSWTRRGVLCLQAFTAFRLMRCARRCALGPGLPQAPGQAWLARLFARGLGLFARSGQTHGHPARGPGVALGDINPCAAWASHFERIAALCTLLPGRRATATLAGAAAARLDRAGPAGLAALLDDAGRHHRSTPRPSESRAARALGIALAPDPAWPDRGAVPPVAHWMTHLAATEAEGAAGAGSTPAPWPQAGADAASQSLSAFRLVSWAETALAARPALARRRAVLSQRRQGLEGSAAAGSAGAPVGALVATQAGPVRPPAAATLHADFWRACLREGLTAPLAQLPPAPGGDADAGNAAMARVDAALAALASGSLAGSRADPAWLRGVFAGGDPFAPLPARAEIPGGQPAEVRSRAGPGATVRVRRHGRAGLIDPLTRGLLARMTRAGEMQAGEMQACAMVPRQSWRRPLHLIDMAPAAAGAALMEGRVDAADPRAVLVLFWGDTVDPVPAEALALAMVDAVWCTGPAALEALRRRHPALRLPLVDLEGAARSRDDRSAPRFTENASDSIGVIGDGSGRSDRARHRASRPWRVPGMAMRRARVLEAALEALDVTG